MDLFISNVTHQCIVGGAATLQSSFFHRFFIKLVYNLFCIINSINLGVSDERCL